MIDVRTWIRKKLVADASYLAAVPATNTVFFYPNTFENLPVVAFHEFNQSDSGYGDNQPTSYDCGIQFDIFTAKNIDPLIIGKLIDNVLKANFFSLVYADDIGDPENKIEHRVQRYRRTLTPEDVI